MAVFVDQVTPNCGLSFCTNYFTAATVESRVYVTSIAALGTAGLGIQLAPWTLCGNLEACPTLPGVEGTVEVTVSVHGVLPTQFSVSFGVNVTAGGWCCCSCSCCSSPPLFDHHVVHLNLLTLSCRSSPVVSAHCQCPCHHFGLCRTGRTSVAIPGLSSPHPEQAHPG